MEKIIEKLGLYEIVNYLFTGIIAYVSSLYIFKFFNIINLAEYNDYVCSLKNWYYVIVLYFIGLMLHEFSELFTKYTFFKKGFISERYFENDKHTKILELLQSKLQNTIFGKIDLQNKAQIQQIFSIIYSQMQNTPYNEIIQKMNRQFGSFRTFSAIFILEDFLVIILIFFSIIQRTFIYSYLLILIPLGIFSFLSVRRMYRFGNRFVDYCYRNYVKD